ncbi:CHAT domain-containing protein [Streptomyces hilarionis]|uniref:CHAT domain-containing protein n=1 Tax=Streptomyces hilarionis TaxID=2839954 RepID=UPI00211A2A76|nr:CHAT domain-containing protein [Streptomyces hilarionis]MCQ9133085.1 CHAT domain-containing protein [Streptomyces hilarionis]
MDDARLGELASRVRDVGDGGDPRRVLDPDALALAADLLASVAGAPEETDPDVLHTVAAFHWARALAQGDGAPAARDHETAVGVFRLLYLVDHRRVPRELWQRFADETGRAPWNDPLEHAADLVVTAEETGDAAALDRAVALIGTVADSGDHAYRDTLHGLALRRRAALPDRPAAERAADADAAVELLAGVAALPEDSAVRRASRSTSLADALVQRFDVTGDPASLARAEDVCRTALVDAAGDASAYARAAGRLGTALGRRAQAQDVTAGDEDDAVTLLREAVGWLRRAVDLTDGAPREAYLAALAGVMRLLLERTSRARRAGQQGEPGEAGEDTEAGAAAGAPRADHASSAADAPLAEDAPVGDGRASRPDGREEVRRQAHTLLTLAGRLAARVITEGEAVRRVKDPSFVLSEDAVVSVVLGASRLVAAGEAPVAVPALTLTLEAARARWPARQGTPWWWAADAYVEVGRLALIETADGLLYRRVCAVADEQIAVLRAGDRAQDVAELAETLFAAGLVRTSPYLGNMSGLTFESAHDLWRERRARQRAVHPDDSVPPETADMPAPLVAGEEAVRYLREAADLSQGHARGRALKALAEALSLVAGLRQESHDEEIRAVARAAFDVLDPVEDPLGRLYLLRVLSLLGELALPGDVRDVLPLPLSAVLARQGMRDAAGVFTEALALAEEARRPDLEFRLIEAADRELPDLPADSYRRRRWASEVHCLADNRLRCSPGPLRPEEAAAEIRAVAERESWTAEQRAATLVHLAAHVRGQDDAHLGRALVAEARQAAPRFCDRHRPALDYLDGRLATDMGQRASDTGRHALAARHFADAVAAYAGCGQTDMALNSLDAALRGVRDADEDSVDAAVAALIPAAVWLRGGVDEVVGWKLRDLYQQLAVRLSGSATVSYGLMLAIHQAAKGMDLTLITGRPGPFTPSARLSRFLARVGADESRLPEPLGRPELPGPDDAMLFYVGTGESEPGGDAETEHRNMQRAADRWISQELLASGRTDRMPMMFPDEVRASLTEDTVLLSLYLGHARRDGAQAPVTSLSGLAVTRDGMEHHTVLLPDFEAGLIRLTRAGHSLSLHPVALHVAALRQAVVADPLHRPVSRAAQSRLRDDSAPYLAAFAAALEGWRARGRRHLCIWPNGPLHYLPYHLLEVDGRPLAEDWTVTQVPSLGFLRTRAPGRSGPSRGGLVAFASAAGGARHGLPGQEALETHTARVAAAMGGHAVLGAGATPRRLLGALADARYVHVAAHGAHNEWAPWYQCLFLSPDADNDGRVFAHDILRADLRGVELVTMSSCESALGRFDVNDNLRGLPAAFLAAGASAVIGCLWPVHPEVATEFFGTLYEHLARTSDRRAAFRAAQTAVRHRRPAYRDWGAFCFIGDWRHPDEPRSES